MPNKPPAIDITLVGAHVSTVLYALVHRNDLPLRHEEILEGRLATALQFFDHFLDSCQRQKCPHLGQNEWLDFLNDLSLNRCFEMKAYHRWAAKGRPFQHEHKDKDADFVSVVNNLLSLPQCPSSMDRPLFDRIRKTYLAQDHRAAIYDKRAFWEYQTRPFEKASTHYERTCGYLDRFYNYMNVPVTVTNLRDLVLDYSSMMSVLDFFVLSCFSRTNSVA